MSLKLLLFCMMYMCCGEQVQVSPTSAFSKSDLCLPNLLDNNHTTHWRSKPCKKNFCNETVVVDLSNISNVHKVSILWTEIAPYRHAVKLCKFCDTTYLNNTCDECRDSSVYSFSAQYSNHTISNEFESFLVLEMEDNDEVSISELLFYYHDTVFPPPSLLSPPPSSPSPSPRTRQPWS